MTTRARPHPLKNWAKIYFMAVGRPTDKMQGTRASGVPSHSQTADRPGSDRIPRSAAWRVPLLALAGLAAVAMLVSLAPGADAVQVDYDQMPPLGSPPNPLKVFIGADLSCQARHIYDGDNGEFYNRDNVPAGCGTYLALGAAGPAASYYTPDQDGHCSYADPTVGCNGGNSDGNVYAGVHTEYTQISQTMTGDGSPGDPYTIVTRVGASSTITLTQTDRYWIGTEDYYTSIEVLNSGGTPQQFMVFRGGDCYLGVSDTGYGWIPPGGIACTMTPNNNPSGRYIRFDDLTTAQGVTMSYFEGDFADMWTLIAQKQPLPNTCTCAEPLDNGIAMAWQGTVPAAGPGGPGSVVVESSISFRPGDPPNQLPNASILYSAGVPTCFDSAIRFNGIVSDSDGTIASIVWDFGDGSDTSSELNPSHTYKDAGSYLVTLTVTDNKGGVRVATSPVPAVADTNCCPKMHPVGNQAIMEGEFVRFFLVAEDFERDTLSYSLQGTMPPEASFDPDAGYFFWRTGPGHAGVYQFNIIGDDGNSHDPPCSMTGEDPVLGLIQVQVNIFVTKGPSRTTSEDKDNDGIDDFGDNCPGVSNNQQLDSNIDGIGDACQEDPFLTEDDGAGVKAPPNVADSDGDLLEDAVDNCPGIANSNQKDSDLDRLGDVCDEDLDGDGVAQHMKLQPAKPLILDNCPMVPNADQRDDGQTGIGNACRPETLARPDALGAEPSGVPNDGSGAGNPDFGVPLPIWLAGFAFVAGIVTVSLILFVVGRKKP